MIHLISFILYKLDGFEASVPIWVDIIITICFIWIGTVLFCPRKEDYVK